MGQTTIEDIAEHIYIQIEKQTGRKQFDSIAKVIAELNNILAGERLPPLPDEN